jgi:L-methionine (R)-S-oxide reductase
MANDSMNAFRQKIEILLHNKETSRETVLEQALREVLKHFSSETGTIHKLHEPTQLLHLVAQAGLPPQLLEIVKTIPVGKGIAGETVAKNRPVTICNLQTDTGGVARPGAKQTGVGGALCVPIRVGDKIVGTLGIGTKREHEYSAAEINALQDIANSLTSQIV